MINQKGNKQVRMNSWLLKLMTRDMKTKAKNKDQPTNGHKNNRKTKNNRKVKAMRSKTSTTDHHHRNGQMGGTDP